MLSNVFVSNIIVVWILYLFFFLFVITDDTAGSAFALLPQRWILYLSKKKTRPSRWFSISFPQNVVRWHAIRRKRYMFFFLNHLVCNKIGRYNEHNYDKCNIKIRSDENVVTRFKERQSTKFLLGLLRFVLKVSGVCSYNQNEQFIINEKRYS